MKAIRLKMVMDYDGVGGVRFNEDYSTLTIKSHVYYKLIHICSYTKETLNQLVTRLFDEKQTSIDVFCENLIDEFLLTGTEDERQRIEAKRKDTMKRWLICKGLK